MPHTRCVFVQIQQIIDLANDEVGTKDQHHTVGQQVVLTHPKGHKRLIQAGKTANAKSRQPGQQKSKFPQILIVFLLAFGYQAVTDSRQAGTGDQGHKAENGIHYKEVVLIFCKRSQA